MTDNTQPEALRLANVCSNLTRYSMDAHLIAAELRRQHNRIAELEAQIAAVGAGGVQALSAAPADIAKLRHLYANLKNGGVRDTAQAKRIADGLLAPIIERLELYQAAPKAAPQQEAQEPVAWLNPWRADQVTTDYDAYGEHGIPLCIAPQPAPAPLSDDVSQKTWALLDELEKLRGANRDEEDWDTLNKRDDELRAALAALGGK